MESKKKGAAEQETRTDRKIECWKESMSSNKMHRGGLVRVSQAHTSGTFVAMEQVQSASHKRERRKKTL